MQKNKIKQNKKHELSSNTIAAISSIVILLGLFIFSYNYFNSKKVLAYDYMDNIFYKEIIKEKKEESNNNEIIEEKEEIQEEKVGEEDSFGYIGYLEIPKIGLRKGFVKKESENNDVEKNIFIVNKSDYPSKDKGNFIVAGHSGTGWKAFFNDLYKLEIGDYAYVDYNNKKYTYKIDNIYKQNKTGTIAIYRDYSKTTLTLVTCTNFDDKTQTVYIAYLEKVE